jgi:hypothetical protein
MSAAEWQHMPSNDLAAAQKQAWSLRLATLQIGLPLQCY